MIGNRGTDEVYPSTDVLPPEPYIYKGEKIIREENGCSAKGQCWQNNKYLGNDHN